VISLAIVLFVVAGGAVAAPPPQSAGLLTIDSLVGIRHPSRACWSPDGRRVAFVWDRGGVQNVFVVGFEQGRATGPKALTRHDEGLIDGLFWDPRGERLYFARGGDLWAVAPQREEPPRPVWTTPESEGGVAISPDGSRVAFLRGEDIWVRQLGDGREVRLTASPAARSALAWSPDGSHLAFTVASATRRDEALGYVGAKLLFSRFERSTSDVGVVPVSGGGEPTVVAGGPGTEAAPRWIDAQRLSVQRITEDLKTREVLVVPRGGGEPRVLHRDADSKWWSLTYLNPDPIPSPDGRLIAFISDADGWDHLYVVPSGGGAVSQITRGRYEVSSLAWSPDGRRIAFDKNEGEHPGSRQLAIASIGDDPATAKVITVTSGPGTQAQPIWSPDGGRLLYQRTDSRNSADLFVTEAEASGAKPSLRLTDSFPPEIDRGRLVAPKLVRYPAPDGEQVPAYLFTPPDLDTARRHPAIVWIHGDGITQNYDGWHLRRDYAVYYSFHQYLVQRGYVVLAVDYRGSIGYGKAWRQGHFRDLGGKDYQDVAAGMDYLKSLGYVDLNRVGVWGLSYGGFMTLQALTVSPRLFRCGIDVAGVVDWRDWYADPDGPWIKGRMGSPGENPELYRTTAPIERADRIERPLMVMHGTADVNVPFVESVRLIDTLTKLGKDVEFVMYPGEFHYFHRAHVLADAWRRVERFFDAHLRQPGPTPSAGR
jgi:dipeptidyl aminopeptidase/acylaminoacyl peptidase